MNIQLINGFETPRNVISGKAGKTKQDIAFMPKSYNSNLSEISKNYVMARINNNVAFGNGFSRFVTGKNQELFLELSDKAKKAAEVVVSILTESTRRKEQDLLKLTSKVRESNGAFRMSVDCFDNVDNSPFKNISLLDAVFFDAKGAMLEKLQLIQSIDEAGKAVNKTVRTIDGKEEQLAKNITFSPLSKIKEVELKSVIIDGFESKNDFDIFATAKTEGKLAVFSSYADLKNYDGENVIAVLTPKASADMFSDMVMSTFTKVKGKDYQAKLDKLKADLEAGVIDKAKYDAEIEVQRLVNEDFFLPLNIKGLIAPKNNNIDMTSLFSSLGHVRARLQNRQSVMFAPESFTKMLMERYSTNDNVKLSVFPTGLKIDKVEKLVNQDTDVVLQKPQYVNELLTFADGEDLFNERSVGVKANNLRKLAKLADKLGVKVPDTFVIPAGFVNRMNLDLDDSDIAILDTLYKKSLKVDDETKKLLRAQLQEELRRMQLKILGKEIPQDCQAELDAMLKKYGFDKEKGIVRSSMNGEDNKNLQTAGLYDSVIFDGTGEFYDSMKEVAASKWSYMAYLSRMQNKIPHSDVSINMPVQKLVDGDYIGTAYTADARVGDTNKLIVQMAPGIDCTISGTPYTFTTDVLSGDVDRVLARKQRKKTLSLMTKDDRDKKLNYIVTDYSRDFWNKTPEEYRPYLRKINEVLMKIKKAFGAEQDVEFVLKLDRDEQDIATGIEDIYLVQTRDIKM